MVDRTAKTVKDLVPAFTRRQWRRMSTSRGLYIVDVIMSKQTDYARTNVMFVVVVSNLLRR